MTRSGIDNTMGARDWGLILTLSLVWGGSFLFVGIAVKEVPPLTIVAVRVALAAAALHAVLRIAGLRLPATREVWRAFLAMGLVNNVIPFTLTVWGQGHIASGLASILNATTPLFTVLVAHVLTPDEKINPQRLGGVLVGFAGVAAMVGPAALESLGINVLAQVAILAAAIAYAFAGVYGRRFRKMGVPPLATATGQVTASSLVLVPIALVLDQPFAAPMPSMATLVALVALALVSTAFAYILYFRVLATAGATNVVLVTLLIPVSAVLLGAVVLGERLEPRHALGMGLIGIGLALIDGRPMRALARRLAA